MCRYTCAMLPAPEQRFGLAQRDSTHSGTLLVVAVLRFDSSCGHLCELSTFLFFGTHMIVPYEPELMSRNTSRR